MPDPVAPNTANDASCGGALVAGVGCVAVSGTGNASNELGEDSGQVGCIAISVQDLLDAPLPEG